MDASEKLVRAITIDKFAKESGFESGKELHKMTANVDLRDYRTRLDFESWKQDDGTKEGLAKLKTMRKT